MKYILILIWFLFVEVAGAQVTLVGDQIKSSNKTKTWTPPSATDTLVGRSSTDTLTNKTINGSLNTITNVDLTAAVTGVLPVANGGTGRSSLTSNNLLIGNGTGSVSLLAPGANGTALVVSGGVWTAGTVSASGSGDVTGTASSVSGEAVIFNSTSGKSIGRATGTGIARLNSGVLTTSSGISLASEVSGTLPLANGGTGQATKAAAFDALSPMTASGDLIYGGASGTGTRLPKGTDGQVLSLASGLPVWSSAGSGDVTGTASSVSGEIALFGDTTGKKINRATGTGIVSIASGVLSTSSTISMAAGGTGANITASHGGLAYSTASAISIGPVGAAGQVAMSNGAGAYYWSNLFGYRNRFINSDHRVDQLNNGSAQTITAGAALAYTTDQWYAYSTGANVTGQRVAGSGSDQYNYQFTGAASVTGIGFCQRIETLNSYDMNNSTATITLRTSNSLLTSVGWQIWRATTTADTFGSLAAPTVTSIDSGTFTVNSTMANYSATVTIPSAATTGLQVCFTVGAQTSGTWKIANAQIESGSNFTGFERRPYQFELSQAQRYLPAFRSFAANDGFPFVGSAATTAAVSGTFNFFTPTRAPVTGVVISSAANFRLTRHSTGLITPSSITFATGGVNSASVQWNLAGATVDQTYYLSSGAACLIYFTGAQL